MQARAAYSNENILNYLKERAAATDAAIVELQVLLARARVYLARKTRLPAGCQAGLLA